MAVHLHAQGNGNSAATATSALSGHAAAPRVAAMRARGALHMDGMLDEPVWATAQPATRFIQMDPVEGAPASERTEVRVLFDDRYLYIGARMHDSGPVTSRLGRRDSEIPDSDWFTVSLDGYHDHITALRFAVNPAGVVSDETASGAGGGGDGTWDPVWKAVTSIDSGGWTAEMRIPLSQLRFRRHGGETWGIQFERRISRKNEHAVYSFTSRRERGGVARYGHLDGMGGVSARSHQLELLPYTLGTADFRRPAQSSRVAFANPFRDGSRQTAGYGVDLKYLPTSNVTINATVNPDFGQVEVDPAVINLTAFEVRFQERRPFFVEGSELFRFGGGDGGGGRGGPGGGGGGASSILYSRRIGRSPQLPAANDVAYADAPDASTILGAVKMITRTASGWSFGLVDAVTQLEVATVVDTLGNERDDEFEPRTNYLALRARRELRNGQTTLGAISTAVHRDLATDVAADRLRRSAYTNGIDFRHEWAERTWSATGYVAGSHVDGRPAVMIAAQRSSARYFQRPDAGHLAVDSAAESLTGWAGRLDVGKRAGLWRGNVTMSATNPSYEINDLGFQTSADRIEVDANFSLEQNEPSALLRRYNLRVGPDMGWTHGWERIRTSIGTGGGGQFHNFWNFGFNFSRELESLDDRLTRGGVLAATPPGNSGFVFISTDSRRAYTGRLSVSGSNSAAGDWRFSTNWTLRMRPGSNMEIQLGPNFARSRNVSQYLTSVSDTLAGATYGRRYVFGDLVQSSFSIETRLNLTFRPNLSLELFAQPLLSSGDYRELRELSAPGTYQFATYGRDAGTVTPTGTGSLNVDPDGTGPASSFTISDPDFDVWSLRGNAVLRWEWRPGSTMFLVWQQDRSLRPRPTSGLAGIGRFELGPDGRSLFGLRPDNILMLKVSYWLNP